MADLQGPKLRLGTFENGPGRLTIGQKFRLDSDPTPGDATRVCLPHPEVREVLTPGTVMLLDDGKVRLRVEDSGDGWAAAVVEAGTQLSDRKGLNVPNALLRLSPLTPKDRADLAYALDIGVDWIALSFVPRPAALAGARKTVGRPGPGHATRGK